MAFILEAYGPASTPLGQHASGCTGAFCFIQQLEASLEELKVRGSSHNVGREGFLILFLSSLGASVPSLPVKTAADMKLCLFLALALQEALWDPV